MTTKTTFRPDVEGLRAIAVMAVLLYHLGVPGLSGGFAGVDVFFVISGYLITSHLLRELEATGRIDLPRFWARRAWRLLPLAMTVVASTLMAGWLLLPGARLGDLAADSVGSALYVENWVLASRAVDYLAEDSGVSPLQHYWSLSVEEQFYLAWPVLLLAVFLLVRSRRGLVAVPALVLVGSVVYVAVAEPSYFDTAGRLWELGAGAALAFVPAVTHAVFSRVLVTSGLVAIAVGLLTVDGGTAWPGPMTALPVLGAAAVIAGGRGWAPAWLTSRPALWLGGLSYGIYLWHWPVVVLSDTDHPVALALLGAASVALAWLTKRWIEDPVRQWKPSHARTFTAVGVSAALVCSMAAAVVATRPALDTGVELAAWQPVASQTGPLTPHPDRAPEDVPAIYADGCQVQQGDPVPATGCVYGDVDSDVRVAMLGDSKMAQWHSTVEAIAIDRGWVLTVHTKSACPFTVAGAIEPECNQHGQALLEDLLADPPEYVLLSTGAARTDELVDGQQRAVDQLLEVGVQVVVVADNPYPPGSRYECAAEHIDDLSVCAFRPEPTAGGNALLAELDLPAIDLNSTICPPGLCPVALGGVLLYRQGSHITDTAARALQPAFEVKLDAVLGRS